MCIEESIRRLHESKISRTKAAEALGITIDKLDLMLESLGIEWKPRIRGGSYVIDNVTDTLEGHSERLGVSVAAIRWRLKRGQEVSAPSPVDPITEIEARQFTELRRQGIPAWEAAKTVGRPYNSLKNAAKKYCSDYEDVVAKAPRVRRCFKNDDSSSTCDAA